MTVSTSPWRPSSRTTILTSDPNGSNPLEPSGLTIWNDGSSDWLYLASDNGKIARSLVGSSSWSVQSYGSSHANDFESVTTVTNELMIGVEGARKDVPDPQIKRFDPADTDSNNPLGKFTGSVWNLTGLELEDNAGMEGLTFVPNGQFPSSWLNGASSYYGGVMLAAFQSYPGTIFVYNLPKGSGKSHDISSIHQFTTQRSTTKISDLCFADGKLYVLYDDSSDWLEVLQLNANASAFETIFLTNPPYLGNEAMTVLGSELYLGLDQTSSQFTTNGLTDNYVFEYAGIVAQV